MPFVKTGRACALCGATPGELHGVQGGGIPDLCLSCFDGGKGVFRLIEYRAQHPLEYAAHCEKSATAAALKLGMLPKTLT